MIYTIPQFQSLHAALTEVAGQDLEYTIPDREQQHITVDDLTCLIRSIQHQFKDADVGMKLTHMILRFCAGMCPPLMLFWVCEDHRKTLHELAKTVREALKLGVHSRRKVLENAAKTADLVARATQETIQQLIEATKEEQQTIQKNEPV